MKSIDKIFCWSCKIGGALGLLLCLIGIVAFFATGMVLGWMNFVWILWIGVCSTVIIVSGKRVERINAQSGGGV